MGRGSSTPPFLGSPFSRRKDSSARASKAVSRGILSSSGISEGAGEGLAVLDDELGLVEPEYKGKAADKAAVLPTVPARRKPTGHPSRLKHRCPQIRKNRRYPASCA